jgi:hypothetical protein
MFKTHSVKTTVRRGVTALAATTLLLGATMAATAGASVVQNDSTSFPVTAGSLNYTTVPAAPTLNGVTLNGTAQTTTTQMTNFGVVDATGSGSGWDVTVNGQGGTGNSATFAEYCPSATCGTNSGPGYVTSGATLAANSLTLNSTGASFPAQSGSTGTAPTLACNSGCFVDAASATKVATAAVNAGMGTFQTTGFSGTSLALATPSTLKTLQSGEVFRVNLAWTLNTGP